MTVVTSFPKIDYTSRDYAALRQSMLTNVADKTGSAAGTFEEWTAAQDPSPNDFGVALIEAFAYLGDIQSWYIDRVALESFLQTATLRSSVINIAQMLDYQPIDAQPATVQLVFTIAPASATGGSAGTIIIPAGTVVSTPDGQPDVCPVVTFETDTDLYVQQDPTNTVASDPVQATQGLTVPNEDAGTSDGSPSQSYALAQGGVLDGSVVVAVNEGEGTQTWTLIDHLIDANQSDTVFTVQTDSMGQTTVVFGDGVNGKIPAPGASVTVTYKVGGGSLGNVGAGTITDLINTIPGVISVTSGQASGGVDAESIESIRVNAPRALTTLKRCVSLADYANVTLGIKQVAKAQAVGIVYTNIVLYACDYNGTLDLGLQTTIENYLSDKTMAGAVVTVQPPMIRGVEVTASIVVNARYNQAAVKGNVIQALNDQYSLANTPFKQDVMLSDIYGLVLQVPGVVNVLVSVLTRQDNPTVELGVTAADGEILIIESGSITIDASGGITTT